MDDRELAHIPALELKELIATKQVSPVEVTELYYRRIEELDPQLNSYLTLDQDAAMATAREAEAAVQRGDELGPLHGLPISIKDLELSKGIRTTGGSLIYKGRIPEEDSVVVERVRQAGAIVLGKTNTPEFGLLGRTENRLGDPCGNPWDPTRTAGGSSGGAAASVIAGLTSLATGSDGGGSTRIPASFCGAYGIKPTQGRIPMYGGAAAVKAGNFFSQSGPITRTVRDSAMLFQVLSGYDARDASALRDPNDDYLAAADKGVKGLRIAWSPDYGYAPVDPEVKEMVGKAARVFEELGCSVEETDLALDSPFDWWWKLFGGVVLARYGSVFEEHRDQLADYSVECFEVGAEATGADVFRSLGQMDLLKAQFDDLFEKYDLLISPTLAVPAFPHGKPPTEIGGKPVHWFWGYLPFTYPINAIGHCAVSIPCGFSSEGLPIGMHIVGRRLAESTLIAASAAFEEARPWSQDRATVS